MLGMYLTLLGGAIMAHKPDIALVMAGKYLLTDFDRDALPDWVEAVANANLDNWAAAVDEVRAMIREEGVK